MDATLIGGPLLFSKAAMLVVIGATVLGARRAQLGCWTMYLAAMAGFGGALIVSWLYVAFFAHSPEEIGGRAAFGAFIGAAVFGGLVLKLRGAGFLRYADAGVPGVALGYFVYRLGCFVTGCCFGIPTDVPWAISFGPGTEAYAAQRAAGWLAADAAHSLHLHPTQLYHAAAGLLIFLACTRMAPGWPGRRLAFALLAYGLARFVIEFYRGNAQPIWLGLDVNQLFCIAMVILAAALWWRGSLEAQRLRARVRWA